MIGGRGNVAVKVKAEPDDVASLELADLAVSKREDSVSHPPSAAWVFQCALALAQASFVVGSVFLKASMSGVDESTGEVFHPIVFAFFREAGAAPLLLSLSWWLTRVAHPARRDVLAVVALGFCMFASQLFFIIGIELSGVLVATCIQPAIPVFTVMLGIALGSESAEPRKLLGIALAVAGALAMVAGGLASSSGHGHGHAHVPLKANAAALNATALAGNATLAAPAEADNPGASSPTTLMLLGNLALLVNTLGMGVYYVLVKHVVQRYPAITVSAWAYTVAAVLMGVTAMFFTEAADWNFPRSMHAPLFYWIFVCSVVGYFVVTWSMRHLPASQVAAFQCLQPFVGTVLAAAVLGEQPSWWDAGAFGVVGGLVLVGVGHKPGRLPPKTPRVGRSRSMQVLLGGGNQATD